MSEAAVSYAFEQLAPSDPVSADGLARTVAQADAQADGIREKARAEGYAEGRAAGYDDGVAEISSAVVALGEALSGVQALGDEVAGAVERDAIELALALAGKIVAGSLQAKPELVVEVVQGVLRRINGQHGITVFVNPTDLETVRAAVEDLRAHGNSIELRDIQADPRIQPGGALARTTEGELDVSVQTQLERAREVVLAELGSSESSA